MPLSQLGFPSRQLACWLALAIISGVIFTALSPFHSPWYSTLTRLPGGSTRTSKNVHLFAGAE